MCGIQSLATEICPTFFLYTSMHIHTLALDAKITVYCSKFNVIIFSITWQNSKINMKQCSLEVFLIISIFTFIILLHKASALLEYKAIINVCLGTDEELHQFH